jgi:hypothetical protein
MELKSMAWSVDTLSLYSESLTHTMELNSSKLETHGVKKSTRVNGVIQIKFGTTRLLKMLLTTNQV